jgi:ribosomal protein S18 acetylase RimI-like enzyme
MKSIRISIQDGSCIGTIYNNGKATIMVVDSVEVNKSQQHKGIGTALMEKTISVAEDNNVDAVELIVNSDNEVAKGLYRKVGFQKTNKEHYRLILRQFK